MGFAQPAVVERQQSSSTQKQQQLSRTPTHQPHTPNLLPPKQKKMVSKLFAPLLASVVLAALVAFAVATDVPQNRKLLQLPDLTSAVSGVDPATVASPLFDQLGTTIGDVIPNPLSSLPGISGVPVLGDLFSNANSNLMSNSGTQIASSLQSLLGLG